MLFDTIDDWGKGHIVKLIYYYYISTECILLLSQYETNETNVKGQQQQVKVDLWLINVNSNYIFIKGSIIKRLSTNNVHRNNWSYKCWY